LLLLFIKVLSQQPSDQ